LEIRNRMDPDTGVLGPGVVNGVAQGPPVEIVHPTFLYEMVWNLGVTALVVWADRRFQLGHGRTFALYVAGYTAGRFWIELMRVDPAMMIFGLRINVITSAVVFLGAVLYMALGRRGREDPETLTPQKEPALAS
jgi:prolipoprotein diacylglyceryltransferase